MKATAKAAEFRKCYWGSFLPLRKSCQCADFYWIPFALQIHSREQSLSIPSPVQFRILEPAPLLTLWHFSVETRQRANSQ